MFSNLYSLNVFTSSIEGLNNKRLAELALEEAENLEKRKSEDPSATGYEDSPLDPAALEVKQLRHTIKKIMSEHIDPRLNEGEIWAHVLKRGETTQIHSHRNKKDWDLLNVSWVYYPRIPEGENIGGKIVFQTHIGSIKNINKDFTPKTGMFIIFPSWLSHFTTRCSSEEIRISISGNYRVSEKNYDEVARDSKSGIKKLTGF